MIHRLHTSFETAKCRHVEHCSVWLQGGESVMFTIRRDELRGLDMNQFIDAFNDKGMSISFGRNSVKVRTDLSNRACATTLMQDTIARLSQFHTAPGPVSTPGQMVTPATLHSGGGQSTDTGQTAGSFRIPSAYLSTQPLSSREIDKNLTGHAEQAAGVPAQPDHTALLGSFSVVDRPADAHVTDSTLPQVPREQAGGGLQKSEGQVDDAESFVVLTSEGQATARLSDAARSGDTEIPGGHQTASSHSTPASFLEDEALAYLLHQTAYEARMESLDARSMRQEDVPLTPQEFSRLGSSLDCKSEGIEAYIKLLPDQNKVVIFAFDYNAMQKAKHLVKIKTGKVMKRSRSKGKEDGESSSRDSCGDSTLKRSTNIVSTAESIPMMTFPLSHLSVSDSVEQPTNRETVAPVPMRAVPQESHISRTSRSAEHQTPSPSQPAVQPTRHMAPVPPPALLTSLNLPPESGGKARVDRKEFVTNRGLKVSVYTADITTLHVGAIVNAANEEMTHQVLLVDRYY